MNIALAQVIVGVVMVAIVAGILIPVVRQRGEARFAPSEYEYEARESRGRSAPVVTQPASETAPPRTVKRQRAQGRRRGQA